MKDIKGTMESFAPTNVMLFNIIFERLLGIEQLKNALT